jgi:hypothetical protein
MLINTERGVARSQGDQGCRRRRHACERMACLALGVFLAANEVLAVDESEEAGPATPSPEPARLGEQH